jgi:hypothetical protein
MNKRTVFLAAVLLGIAFVSAALPAAAGVVEKVATVPEFYKALGSDRTVEFAAGEFMPTPMGLPADADSEMGISNMDMFMQTDDYRFCVSITWETKN